MINYNDIEVILEERSKSDFLFDVNLGILKHLTEFLKVFKQVKNYQQMIREHFIYSYRGFTI